MVTTRYRRVRNNFYRAWDRRWMMKTVVALAIATIILLIGQAL